VGVAIGEGIGPYYFAKENLNIEELLSVMDGDPNCFG
jgi:hypothetical protein